MTKWVWRYPQPLVIQYQSVTERQTELPYQNSASCDALWKRTIIERVSFSSSRSRSSNGSVRRRIAVESTSNRTVVYAVVYGCFWRRCCRVQCSCTVAVACFTGPQGPEARQRAIGSWRTREADWLWHVQGGHDSWANHANVLRHSRLHCSRGRPAA